MHDMNNDIAKVLISEEQLQAKVAELGAQISRDYEAVYVPMCADLSSRRALKNANSR